MRRLTLLALPFIVLLVVAVTPAVAQTTIGPIIVATGNDDGDEAAAGNTSGVATVIGSLDTTGKWGYWRFTGITIPAGATITDAYLTFQVASVAADEPDVTIYGVDDGTAAQPAWATNGVVSGQPRTTATVNWASTDLGGPGDFNTPSLATIVQELVDSYSYSSGVMAFVITSRAGDTARDLSVVARDDGTNGATQAGRLTITYTTGGGGGSGAGVRLRQRGGV